MTTRPDMITPIGGSGAGDTDGADVAGTPPPWITRSCGRPGAGAATHAEEAIAATIANAKKRTPPNGRIGRLTPVLPARFPPVGGPYLAPPPAAPPAPSAQRSVSPRGPRAHPGRRRPGRRPRRSASSPGDTRRRRRRRT